jgi:type IV pilus assembly protein PilC
LVLSVRSATASKPRPRRRGWLRPRSVDVEVSLQQLAVMLRSGLTLLAALRTVADQAARPRMADVWERVAERLQEGSNLADALAEHRCFPMLCVQLVRVGEQTGTLDVVLNRAADIMERQRGLLMSVLSALAYPFIVLLAALGTTFYMVFFVLPRLSMFLASSNRRLPALTQLLVDSSRWLVDHSATLGLVVLASGIAVVLVYRWEPGRRWLDRGWLRVPILGHLDRLGATALFARSLGLLLASGVTLLEALRTVRGLFRNVYVAEQVDAARQTVLRGGSLAEGIADPLAFMPMLPRMVTVGEATGSLEEVLAENARFHEEQMQRTIRWLAIVIEPTILVLVGSIVGFVYIAFFLALFSAGTAGR